MLSQYEHIDRGIMKNDKTAWDSLLDLLCPICDKSCIKAGDGLTHKSRQSLTSYKTCFKRIAMKAIKSVVASITSWGRENIFEGRESF